MRNKENITQMIQRLLHWFKQNQRQLPWRENRNWYTVWISEVMLQQTQVDTVIPYYICFRGQFSDVTQLATATEEEVLKAWEGLGYYARARNLHKTAKILKDQYKAQLPRSQNELLKLPGFGLYITNATLSLAFNLPFAVVDGNVKRVISRIAAISDDIRKPATHVKIQNLVDKLLPPDTSRDFNEAIMELGALVCTPVSPVCEICPLIAYCQSYQKKIVHLIPYKSAKPKNPVVHSMALIFRQRDKFLVAKRPPEKLLAGLWEFPMIQSDHHNDAGIIKADTIYKRTGLSVTILKHWPEIRHSYTHFNLRLHSALLDSITGEFRSDFYVENKWLDMDKIIQLPLHRAMWKVLNKVGSELKIITQ
jgi:A/G-specific adenine glycosylase